MTGLEVTTASPEGRSATTVRCKGFIDAHTYDRLEASLDSALDRDVLCIVVDLGEVTYISSAGLGVLVGAYRRAEEQGGVLVLVRPRPEILSVLRDTGLDHLFAVARSEDEVLQHLDAGNRTGDGVSMATPTAPEAHRRYVARLRKRFEAT